MLFTNDTGILGKKKFRVTHHSQLRPCLCACEYTSNRQAIRYIVKDSRIVGTHLSQETTGCLQVVVIWFVLSKIPIFERKWESGWRLEKSVETIFSVMFQHTLHHQIMTVLLIKMLTIINIFSKYFLEAWAHSTNFKAKEREWQKT